MERKIALYSGWGIERDIRNPGDYLCHLGAISLLANNGITDLVDIRRSYEPITEPWEQALIIGGGTVLPTVFEHWVGPGLKYSSDIYIFGSGMLSPEEMRKKEIARIDLEPYQRSRVIGLRGPLSVKYYYDLFGTSAAYIGDLGFAFAQNETRVNKAGPITFFYIENNYPSSRIIGSQEHILEAHRRILASPAGVHDTDSKIIMTDSHEFPVMADIALYTEISKLSNALALIDVVAKSSVIVTERLHPAIIAACYGIPFLYLQTTSKSMDLQELFNSNSLGTNFNILFYDMSSRDEEPGKRLRSILENDELPHQLTEVSLSIKRRLESAAECLSQIVRSESISRNSS